MLLALSSLSWSADYKSAQKFNDGDVVSAQVLNDIISRLELTLKSITADEMVGSWAATWRTCVSGGPGNCGSLDVGSGWDSSVDGLYKTRTDTWVISDDEDGTYSISMDKCYTGAVSGSYYNDPCISRLAVDSGILLLGTISGDGVSLDSDHSDMYNIKRTSNSRFTIWKLSSGSNSFVSFTLDKNNLPPEAPTSLTSSVSNSAISLSWTASSDTTSYEIHRKAAASGAFLSIGTSNSASYSDSDVSSGSTYWYRVFANNASGKSIGSNVIKITYNPTASLSSRSIGITDYLNGVASAASEYTLIYTTANNTMTANLSVGKLDAENLNGLLAGTGGKSPVFKFTLINVPSAGMSGTATLATKVLDGANGIIDDGERVISAAVDVLWSSDGNKLTLTVPSQTQVVTLVDNKGIGISGNWIVGGSSDLMIISSSGINKPSTLDVKLLDFLSSNIGASGPELGSFFTSGDYFYEFSISGIDLADASGNSFTTVQGAFGVDSNPVSVAYIDDVIVSEEMGLATAVVTLSSPVLSAVTLDYVTSSNTATGGQDYTTSSGSIRIAAGKTKGAFTIPLTDDSFSESSEQFLVTLSNIANADLGRSSALVTIIDNDTAS
tara:strand:+ start:2681 stop:4513 length:1833 start_codon:yes stop_codon:yes gene_type:complete